MDRDFAVRFSDESYLSQEEIKKTMNLTSIDNMWDRIIEYRGYYTKVLDLFSIDRKPYTICFTQGITNKLVRLEKKFNKLELLSIKFDEDSVRKHYEKEILMILAKMNSMDDVSPTIIEGIIDDTLSVIPTKYQILRNYLLCLDEIRNKSANNLNEITVKRIYSLLLYGNPNKIEDINNVYRSIDINIEDENNIHYDGAPVNRISSMMELLFDYLSESPTFSIALSSFTFYYIYYLKPFDCFNEEMALLLSKYVLNYEGNNSSYLPIEDYLLKLQNSEVKKVFLECESSFDLTYFLIRFIDLLQSAIINVEKKYQYVEEKEIEKEVLVEDKVILEEDKQENTSKRRIIHEVNNIPLGVNFERKISMPTIPSGLDEKDASLIADHLLELCPTLKRGQAEFYARHCTIGKYYTIQQYKDFNNVAYETARTSMDNLAILEFYKKEKIRNKFVYTPVIRSN